MPYNQHLELIFDCLHLGATTTSSSGGGGSKGYTNNWLRGEGPAAHAHEGIRLQDKSGWVAIGETLADDTFDRSQVSYNLPSANCQTCFWSSNKCVSRSR